MRALIAAALALAASATAVAGPDAVSLGYAPPAGRVEYDAEFNLDAELEVAPGAEVAHPYVGKTRISARASARLTVEPDGPAEGGDAIPLLLFLGPAEAFVDAFDSRLEATLTAGGEGTRATVVVNDVEISSETVSACASGVGPFRVTVGRRGQLISSPADPPLAAAALLETLFALARLPQRPVSLGEEWDHTLVFPPPTPAAAPLVLANVRWRLAAVERATSTARIEFAGELSRANRRAGRRVRLPGPQGGPPIEVTLEPERLGGDVSGWISIPLEGGLPVAVEGEMEVDLRARLSSDSPDWEGREVILQWAGRLTYSARRNQR